MSAAESTYVLILILMEDTLWVKLHELKML